MPNEEGKKPEEQVSDDSLYEEYTEETETPPKKKKKGGRGVVSLVIFVVCAAVFVYSMYNIVLEQLANRETDKTVGDFQQQRLEYEESLKNKENDTVENDDTDVPDDSQSSGTQTGGDVEDDRTATVVLDLIGDDVSFLAADLAPYVAINDDTVGWFMFSDVKNKVSGLPIDLPIVYSGDNEYYLDHNFYNEENINGWVFVDYRNDPVNMSENYNTILYGHARSDNMFGGLKYLNTEKSWYENKANHYIYVKTKNEDMIWQIFSWYETSVAEETASTYNYIRTSFSQPDTFVTFCDLLQSKNVIDAFEKFEFTGDDRILTLSTCKSYDKDIRVVVHAKLVKLRVWE